ncbi:hypothetical protein Mkiyose1665_06050 [Mycobacterium kiyosense]|uniref:Uncharacterized protein n=1 Tax=Mycobacterium kiyosense TaxID=2871094 RepID=A0A9P3Q3P4_9MYCO|nr:hypothetical protein MKCMC460_30140 [Mycobacterium sp. 20KCMC460]GLB82987.1 hypothetical protein SRL2020028_22430 [Mycobacterium kiyosense]GLB89172.1 hypothetical protein SRL2020130_19890 [Mycobacterium kiyosense]GLB93823.1 hypothetical protein SRL2020226_05990 [Mycobacterium kiyosense]GLC00037.1 hypothetical protein SRL2020400_06280 [Mycobacterium kiyosense]
MPGKTNVDSAAAVAGDSPAATIETAAAAVHARKVRRYKTDSDPLWPTKRRPALSGYVVTTPTLSLRAERWRRYRVLATGATLPLRSAPPGAQPGGPKT